jgi:hypothetical protein
LQLDLPLCDVEVLVLPDDGNPTVDEGVEQGLGDGARGRDIGGEDLI